MFVLGSLASAQSKEKKDRDDSSGVKTEANAILSNITTIEVTPNKVVAYNDVMVGISGNVKMGNTSLSGTMTQLFAYNDGELSTLSNKMMVSLEQQCGQITWSIETGHKPEELEKVFLNGVPIMNYDMDAKSLPAFGNLTNLTVAGFKKDGTQVFAGIVSPYKGGFTITADFSDPSFYASVAQTFEKEGWTFSLSSTAEVGNINKVFVNASAHNKQVGVAAGGNYDFNTKVSNAYARATYTSLKSDMTYVLQVMKKGNTHCFQLGMGKNGVQGFVSAENVSFSKDKGSEFTTTPTVNFGVSYNISTTRKL